MFTIIILIQLSQWRLAFCDLNWVDASYTLEEGIRYQIYATTSDNQLYTFGGHNSITTNHVYKWDFNAQSPEWELLTAPTPTPIYCEFSECAAIINNRYIHIIGPYHKPGLHYVFDTTNETFISHSIPTMPFPTQGACVNNDPNGNIYVFGGHDNIGGNFLNYLQILDTSTDTWSSVNEGIPNIPTSTLADAPCEYYNGCFYLFGGFDGSSQRYEIHKYDIGGNTWNTLTTTVPIGVRAGRSTVGPDGNIYINTWTATPARTVFYRFDPLTEQIMEDNYIDSETRFGPLFFSLENTIFIGAGNNYDTFKTAFLPSCETEGLINHFNWKTRTTLPSYYNNSITVNENDLSIDINIDLDYVGYSYNQYEEYGYGTVYVLSFTPYDNQSPINEPNTQCGENRIAVSYSGLSFTDYWIYSDNLELNNIDYVAYSNPGSSWSLSAAQNQECRINYQGLFFWDDIVNCQDVVVAEDNNYINLTGSVYVSMVSPFNKDSESGFYYVQPVYSQEFEMSVSKYVNVLSDVGIRLFTMSVIDISPNNNDDELEIILGTQSGDDFYLHSPQLLVSPNSDFVIGDSINNGNCIVNNSNTCQQFFKIIANVSCPYSFDGVFIIQFEIGCKGGPLSCQDNFNSTIKLTSDLSYSHNVCENDKSTGDTSYLEGEFNFYFDSDYTQLYDPANPNHYYVIFTDRVYAQVTIIDPNNLYDIFDTEIENVWICTSLNSLTLDQISPTTTGCFDETVVFMEWIIVNHDESFEANAQLEDENANNLVRFSFIPPIEIDSQTLYIHAQLSVFSVNNNRRRRILLDMVYDNSNQGDVSHVAQYINIQSQNDVDKEEEKTDDSSRLTGYFIVSMLLYALM